MVSIEKMVQKYEKYIISMRREFHMYPEISFEETRTSQRICEELEKINIPYQVVGDRNIVGFIEGGKPRKKIAIRADIDALPIQEETNLPYASKNPGIMHACGHDGHAATLLGVAHILNECKKNLCGTVVLCFQVAEEVGGGAMQIVNYLEEQGGVDRAIALHYMGHMETGTVSIADGPIIAGVGGFKIGITGRSGHGSRPDLSINPLPAACEILLRIMAIPTNRHSPFDTCVVSPCKIVGGSANNIIPEQCEIAGNVRFFRYGDAERLMDTIGQIAETIAASYGCKAELFHKKQMGLPTVNHPESAAFGREIAEKLGLQVYTPSHPDMGSEDFCWFLKAFPGFYAIVGSKSNMPGTSSTAHNCKYDIDEKALSIGAKLLATCALQYLQ